MITWIVVVSGRSIVYRIAFVVDWSAQRRVELLKRALVEVVKELRPLIRVGRELSTFRR